MSRAEELIDHLVGPLSEAKKPWGEYAKFNRKFAKWVKKAVVDKLAAGINQKLKRTGHPPISPAQLVEVGESFGSVGVTGKTEFAATSVDDLGFNVVTTITIPEWYLGYFPTVLGEFRNEVEVDFGKGSKLTYNFVDREKAYASVNKYLTGKYRVDTRRDIGTEFGSKKWWGDLPPDLQKVVRPEHIWPIRRSKNLAATAKVAKIPLAAAKRVRDIMDEFYSSF